MAGTVDWVVGFKKAVTWGTAVALGALNKMKLTAEGLPEGIPEPIKDENIGDALSGQTMQGNVNAEGTIAETVRFEGFERRLALFMGADTVTVVQAGQVFEHVMPFKPSNTGKFGTMVIDKGLGNTRLWEYPSVKLSGLEHAHEDGKLMANWAAIMRGCQRDTAAQINTAVEMALLTLPTNGLMAIFNQVLLRFKEVTGAEGNLAPGDEVLVSDLKLSANRNLSGDHESGSNAGFIGEPETDGLPEASFSFVVANYKTSVDDLIKEANKPQPGREPKTYKAQLVWTGKDIPGSAPLLPFRLAYDLPAFNVRSAPVPGSGPGAKVPVEVTCDIVTPQVVPNGSEWAWVTIGGDPFRARLQNKNATSMA